MVAAAALGHFETVIVGNAIEPCRQPRIAPERVEMLPGGEKDLLGRLAGLVVIAQHSHRQLIDLPLVTLYQHRKGFLIAFLGAGDPLALSGYFVVIASASVGRGSSTFVTLVTPEASTYEQIAWIHQHPPPTFRRLAHCIAALASVFPVVPALLSRRVYRTP